MTPEEYKRRREQIERDNPLSGKTWKNGYGMKDALEGSDAYKAWEGGFGSKDAIEGSDAAKNWEGGYGYKDKIKNSDAAKMWEGAGFLGNGDAPVDPNEEPKDETEVVDVIGKNRLQDIFGDEKKEPVFDELDKLKSTNDIALQNLRRSSNIPFAPRLGGGTVRLTR